LLKYLGDEQTKAVTTLQRSSDLVEIYRTQGDLERINRMISLVKAQ